MAGHDQQGGERFTLRLLIGGAAIAGLAACGGGSGGGDAPGPVTVIGAGPTSEADVVPDSPATDETVDGMGALDIDFDPGAGDDDMDQLVVDPDPDGSLTDDAGPDPDTDGSGDMDGADDLDGDGVLNARDPDVDGDGILNEEDSDVDGDGVPNAEDADADGDGFDEPTVAVPCGSAAGSDADSSNNDWSDNCVIARSGQFAESLYSAGIQRIVYCTLDGVEGDSVDAFADGEFGLATEQAVLAYQDLIGLVSDGVVGPATWTSLRDELELVVTADLSTEEPFLDGYAVAGERCGGAVLFYNEVVPGDDGLSVDRLGWRLAAGAESPAPVPFSIATSVGVVD